MFGKIRRRWRRFRYNNQAQYPGFFGFFDFLKFPAQVALLTVTVWSVVGWYINYTTVIPTKYAHSDNAEQKPESTSPTLAIAKDKPALSVIGSPPTTTNQITTINPIAIEPVTIEPIIVNPSNSAIKINRDKKIGTDEFSIRKTNSSLTANTIAAEQNGSTPAPDSAINLSATDSSRTPSTSTVVGHFPVVDENWVLAQKAGFVVQISSSAQSGRIRELAYQLTELEHVAIYPFKVSASGQQVYGLSAGHYPTYMLAVKSLENLPKEVRPVEPWIRSVSEIKRAIKSVQRLQGTTIVKAKR